MIILRIVVMSLIFGKFVKQIEFRRGSPAYAMHTLRDFL